MSKQLLKQSLESFEKILEQDLKPKKPMKKKTKKVTTTKNKDTPSTGEDIYALYSAIRFAKPTASANTLNNIQRRLIKRKPAENEPRAKPGHRAESDSIFTDADFAQIGGS